MSFDPEKVSDISPRCPNEYNQTLRAVLRADYDKLLALLHDISTEADPAGTLRELRLAQDTVKAQELLIQELRAEIEVLRGEGR